MAVDVDSVVVAAVDEGSNNGMLAGAEEIVRDLGNSQRGAGARSCSRRLCLEGRLEFRYPRRWLSCSGPLLLLNSNRIADGQGEGEVVGVDK